MIINCGKAKDNLKNMKELKKILLNDPDRLKYRNIMKLSYLKDGIYNIDPTWNIMDRSCKLTGIDMFLNSEAKLLHFTDVINQPWYNPSHKAASIWGKFLAEAIQKKYIDINEVKVACSKFNYNNERRPDGMNPFWLKYLGAIDNG